jgi:hypothetical protein
MMLSGHLTHSASAVRTIGEDDLFEAAAKIEEAERQSKPKILGQSKAKGAGLGQQIIHVATILRDVLNQQINKFLASNWKV